MTVKAAEGGSITIGRTTLKLDRDQVIWVVKGAEMNYSAQPDAGYTFVSLDKSSFSATIRPGDQTMNVREEGVILTPVFRKTGNTPGKPALADRVCINEIGYSGSHAVNGSDWIELYNPTGSEISLKGMQISQGEKTMVLPDIRIPAGGFTVLLCDGKGTGRHMNFKISFGETVTLRDAEGKKLDQVKIDCASSREHPGRYPDGGELIMMSNAELTPGYSNVHITYDPVRVPERAKNTYLINGAFFDAAGKMENGRVNRTELIRALGGTDAAKNYVLSLGNSTTVDWKAFLDKFPGRKYKVEASGTYILYLQ